MVGNSEDMHFDTLPGMALDLLTECTSADMIVRKQAGIRSQLFVNYCRFESMELRRLMSLKVTLYRQIGSLNRNSFGNV